MKRALVVLLILVSTSAPANEMVLMPKESAETIVKDNLRLQQEVDVWRTEYEKLRQHRDKLQSSTNCA